MAEMIPTREHLRDTLTAAASGRGVASIAVIDPTGASPLAVWTPESAQEPAFLAYSITKTLIAACVVSLAEEGRVTLDDPLARWFPRIEHAERISLRRLLNH